MIHDRWQLLPNNLVVHPLFLSNVKLKYCGLILQVKAHYFQSSEVVLHFKIVCSTLNHLFCVPYIETKKEGRKCESQMSQSTLTIHLQVPLQYP
jgi:hypothetical protein